MPLAGGVPTSVCFAPPSPEAVRRVVDRVYRDDGIQRSLPTPEDPLGVLAAVGGLEIAALAGLVLGCTARRTPVLVDGFITAAAALVAVRLDPRCADVLIASHRSPEPGHGAILEALGLDPLLDLDLRLGEGSGAALALPLVAAALAILSDMATLEAVLGA